MERGRERDSPLFEDRILALQEKKRQLVENALDENAGKQVLPGLGCSRGLGYLFVSFSHSLHLFMYTNGLQGVNSMN